MPFLDFKKFIVLQSCIWDLGGLMSNLDGLEFIFICIVVPFFILEEKIFFVSFIKKFELNNWSLLTFPCNLLQNQIPILEKANCG